MSRTEHFSLPRIPTSYARVTSPGALTHHTARTMRSKSNDGSTSRSTEPSYTAYIGTRRQDVPRPVLRDAAMYDDVFDKKGQLFGKRTTPKISSPLETQQYSSLHDPHCKRLFLNSKWLRDHLMELGLITEDQRVVASTRQQRETIRAHELLERKEHLMQKLGEQEQRRLERMEGGGKVRLPSTVRWSQGKERLRQEALLEKKKKDEQNRMDELQMTKANKEQERKLQKEKWKKFVEDHELNQQRQRNAEELLRKEQDLASYINRFGTSAVGLELAGWHRDSEVISQRMSQMALRTKANRREKQQLEELESELCEDDGDKLIYLRTIVEARNKKPKNGGRNLESPKYMVEEEQDRNLLQAQKKKKSYPVKTEAKPFEMKGSDSKTKSANLKPEPVADDVIGEALSSVLGQKFMSDQKEKEEKEEKEDSVKGEQDSVVWKEDAFRKRANDPVARQMATESTAPTTAATDQPNSPLPTPTNDLPDSSRRHGNQTPPPPQPQPQSEAESDQLVSEFIIHLSVGYDQNQMGVIDTGALLQSLMNRETGLKMFEEEVYPVLQYVDPESTGWVAYYEVAAVMREVLVNVFSLRSAEHKPISSSDESSWRQLHTPSFGLLYFNVVDGRAQRTRPPEYRPYLQDDVFEDTIVDFFENADRNEDKFIDENDFRELLFSPTVTDQLYEEQKEDLIGLFTSSCAKEGQMCMEEFVPLARTMVTMVYRRHYEGQTTDDWLELNSSKYGPFWLNKNTGETMFPSATEREEHPAPSVPLKRTSMASDFGTESLPEVGDFVSSPTTAAVPHPVMPTTRGPVQPAHQYSSTDLPAGYGYSSNATVTNAAANGHHHQTTADRQPHQSSSSSSSSRKKKMRRKQRSLSTREGRMPPALRRRSQASTTTTATATEVVEGEGPGEEEEGDSTEPEKIVVADSLETVRNPSTTELTTD